MLTHIARQGQTIGKFSPDELEQALENGTIKEGDHWWRAGMKDWIKVSVQSPRLPKEKPVQPQLAEPITKEAWRIRPQHKPSKFGDEPATEKQLALIKQAGLTDVEGLTKYDASRWLDMILDEGREELNQRQFEAYQKRQEDNAAAGLGCNGHRTPSGESREEIASALQRIKDYEEDCKKSIEEERQEIDSQYESRAEYWVWLISVALETDEDEKDELMMESEWWEPHGNVSEVLSKHLFSQAAKLTKVPSKRQIKSLLKRLDTQSQTWDDDQPDLLLTELLKEQE